MYKVLTNFADLNDNKHLYHTGDIFPRDGLKVTDSRFEELASNKNKTGQPLIVEIKEKRKRGEKNEDN